MSIRLRSRLCVVLFVVLSYVFSLVCLPSADAQVLPDMITRVSVASDGTQGNHESYYARLSADGRYVAFTSYASSLVAGDTNGQWDIFVHDRLTNATTRVSVTSGGTQGNAGSGGPFLDADGPILSADGRYVAFGSEASNLVPGDTNGQWDIFVAPVRWEAAR